MFIAPWQSDHIVYHVTDQHADQFKTYSALTDEQKKAFFDEPSSLPDSTSRCFCLCKILQTSDCNRYSAQCFLDKSIVEGINGD